MWHARDTSHRTSEHICIHEWVISNIWMYMYICSDMQWLASWAYYIACPLHIYIYILYVCFYERACCHSQGMKSSCHPRIRHVKYKWVMSHANGSCHTWMTWYIWVRRITFEWVGTNMNSSCHTRIRHVTHAFIMSHMNESCHIKMSHVTYEWVMSQINESTMNESCHI